MRRLVSLAALGLLLPLSSFAQGGQAPPAPAPSGGGQPSGGGSRPSSPNASDRTRPQTQFPDNASRPIYVSGKVMLPDGSPPPTSVVVERVCNGVVRPEGYTDSKGNFSFQLGGQSGMFYEASIGIDPLSQESLGGSGLPRGINERDVAGCEIRANLAGFVSSSVPLGFRRTLDDPDIGIVRLYPMEKVEGFTFSVTTDAAPKDARKAYENGLNNIKSRKWPQAERELMKAVAGYPQYALAWYDLGRVYQQQNKLDDAHRAYEEAVKADAKFISPYGQLVILSVGTQKWDDVLKYSSQMLALNPHVTPDIYFYSAVANYNLQEYDKAEELALQAAKLDTEHRYPRINHLLGVMLAEVGDYKGAAENLRIYLQFAPNAPDAAAVKEELAKLEKAEIR